MKRTIAYRPAIWACERGSFTIEATLTFPLILLCTAAVLFLGLQLYQSSYLTQKAGLAAERIADTWDNSYKDLTTGAFPLGMDDGLYWRLFQDDVLDIFGGKDERVSVQFPSSTVDGDNSLALRKLGKAAVMLPEGVSSELNYENRLIDRRITAQLNRRTQFPGFIREWFRSDYVQAVSTSHIIEPAEWVRLTDLTRTYGKKLREFLKTPDAKTAFQTQTASKPALSINSEYEARVYLMRLVNGRTVTYETVETGESRKIDALDPDGIAHEAKYTVNHNQARQEMLKDVELIKKGKIKGAVWHFFKNKKKGVTGLTPSLRQQLENNGIMIVVHD